MESTEVPESKAAYNKAFGKSGADGRNLSSISLFNFSYGLTDSNPLCGAAQESYRKLNFGSYVKFSFL